MLANIIESLICPHCDMPLRLSDSSVLCSQGHTFDVARQGYVNLLSRAAGHTSGDTAQMVQARQEFLTAGHFATLGNQIAHVAAQQVHRSKSGVIADIGAGTGYYSSLVLDELTERFGVAIDISKYALRRAARAHTRIGAVVGDAWKKLPLRTSSTALVLNIFAPRNPAELARVLVSDGTLLLVSPTTRHLGELVSALGLLRVDENKETRLGVKLGPYFDLIARDYHETKMTLQANEVEALIAMGPNAWHTDIDSLRHKIRQLGNSIVVTSAVAISTYRRGDHLIM